MPGWCMDATIWISRRNRARATRDGPGSIAEGWSTLIATLCPLAICSAR